MRAVHLIPVFMFVTCTGFGQVTPVPDSPLELGNGAAQAADQPEQRDVAVELLRGANGYLGLHRPDEAPFTLRVAFSALGPWAERGSGELEETWISAEQWRWTAQVGNYRQLRIFTNGAAYDEKPATAMPLPMQMLRNAIFGAAPVNGGPHVRTVGAKLNGVELTCLLISEFEPPARLATAGRQWQEGEYCVDPRSGMLRTSSRAPGIYIVYDYSARLPFHRRVLPGKITFVENNADVMEATLLSISDADASDSSLFTPTTEMLAAGPQPIFNSTFKLVQNIRSASVKPGDPLPTIVVHAVVDLNGNVTEAEALQSGAMSSEAVDAVKNSHYPPPAGAGQVPPQRQAFITVHFLPATAPAR